MDRYDERGLGCLSMTIDNIKIYLILNVSCVAFLKENGEKFRKHTFSEPLSRYYSNSDDGVAMVEKAHYHCYIHRH